jgi:hypothetical protein
MQMRGSSRPSLHFNLGVRGQRTTQLLEITKLRECLPTAAMVLQNRPLRKVELRKFSDWDR